MTELAPPLHALSLPVQARLKAFTLTCVAAVVVLEVWAAATGYGLRVTSDTPTFLPIVRDLGLHPLGRVSPFLDDPHVATSHATPYTQLLGLLWRATAGSPGADPKAIYTLLAVAGLAVTLLLVHAIFVWSRSQSDARTAWLTIPTLLVLFGPAHVIWAGDLTFHGFLYSAYFPQNVALAFLLYALTALEGEPGHRRTLRVTLCVATTLTVHPFTGALLVGLIAARGCALAIRRRPDWRTGSVAVLAGFGLGALWPAYSLNVALAETGLKGWVFVAACAAAPLVARGFEQPQRVLAAAGRAARRLEEPGPTRRLAVHGLAFAGLAMVALLTSWELVLAGRPSSDPLIHTNRLAIYWVEDRWRWLPMLAAGSVGIAGLCWLARRGSVVPALWFGICVAIGSAGAVGLPVPVWWRFILFAQLPLALGVARVLTSVGSRTVAHGAIAATLVCLLAVKATTLFALPARTTYFGTALQDTYDLSQIVPSAPGLVVTDPFTAYYVPGSTGHRVLSVTKAHVNSSRELAESARGYDLLHRFYSGRDWWRAAARMYREGVRYVLVAKQTSLAAPTLAEFSTGPTPLIRTAAERRQLSRYFYRCNRVGTLLYDSSDYVVYRLDPSRLGRA